MSLAKIPLAILIPYAYKIVSTSPNPPAPDEEIVPTMVDWRPGRNFAIKTIQIGMALAAAVEVATILAYNISPFSSISQAIMSTFTFEGGDPSRIRLTVPTTLGAALIILGTIIRIQTYKQLGRFFVFEITVRKNHQLITNGPYAWVRHPAYTAIVMVDIGWILWTLAKGSWVEESGFWYTRYGPGVFFAYLLFLSVGPMVTLTRMTEEDLALKEKFGRKWNEWAEKVPYRLIPGVY